MSDTNSKKKPTDQLTPGENLLSASRATMAMTMRWH